ncbi:hypothetical protein LPW36_00460 [Jinshanibacter sp. LJY008]|uniref:DUF3299 domain-containing protein n=1 Tax=Limnobaculum eriocheiris TaxID=2897391 RepID=A0A9X1SJT4_9GAMM|nr:hypothetical protein [Limnobaculum eriocheiris]MCD1124519.1 hypothetical protein [Limnobaculum eriocheiris]
MARYRALNCRRFPGGFSGWCNCQWLLLILFIASPLKAEPTLTFEQFYSKVSVLGLEFSDPVKQLSGKRIEITGFMAPPIKAESQFFVLTKMPMAICPFCSSDADWPEDILVVYLTKRQTFVQNNSMIKVTGTLEYGTWHDKETGFVSLLRLRDAQFSEL